MGDHAGHDGQELFLVIEIAEIAAGEVHGQRADDLAAHDHGHADEAEAALLAWVPGVNSLLEPRLRGDAGDDHRCSGSQDLAGDSLADAVAEPAPILLGNAGRRGELQLGTVRRDEHDGSPRHAQLGLENLENLQQRLFLARPGRQHLGRGVQGLQVAMRRASAIHALRQ